MTYHAYGDSITLGTGNSVPAAAWVAVLGSFLGTAIANHGVSGAMVMDEYEQMMAVTPSASDTSLIMLGTNDAAKYGSDPAKLPFYIDGLRSAIARFGSPCTQLGPSTATYTGTWNSTGLVWSIHGGKAVGSKCTFSFTGTRLMLGMLRQVANTSTYRVKIDGTDKGTFSTSGDVTTILGRQYGPACFAFTGLSAGSHSCEIEMLSGGAGAPIYPQFYSTGGPLARVCVVNTPHSNGATSDAVVDTYNTALAALVSEMHGYGVDVVLANVRQLLGPSDMADSVHPNDAGHNKIASAVYTALTANFTYFPVTLFQRGDGAYFVGEGANRKQVTVT